MLWTFLLSRRPLEIQVYHCMDGRMASLRRRVYHLCRALDRVMAGQLYHVLFNRRWTGELGLCAARR